MTRFSSLPPPSAMLIFFPSKLCSRILFIVGLPARGEGSGGEEREAGVSIATRAGTRTALSVAVSSAAGVCEKHRALS